MKISKCKWNHVPNTMWEFRQGWFCPTSLHISLGSIKLIKVNKITYVLFSSKERQLNPSVVLHDSTFLSERQLAFLIRSLLYIFLSTPSIFQHILPGRPARFLN